MQSTRTTRALRVISRLGLGITFLNICLVSWVEAEEEARLESAAVLLERVLIESGTEAAWIRFGDMRKQGETKFEFDEDAINMLGYKMIKGEDLEAAIAVFEMNTELAPESWNVWDSLGEAYIFSGIESEARESLMKSQKLLYPEAEEAWRLNDRVEGKIFNYSHETKVRNRFEPGETTGLQGPYLGQAPPGHEPEVFAPGIVSIPRAQEFSSTFSPDGREFYFNRDGRILVTYWRQDGWTAPEIAWFNTPELNHEPHITADGKRLYFGSGRARPDKTKEEQSYGIWMMEKSEDSWSDPVFAFDGMYVTTTRDGRIYVTTRVGEDRGVGVVEVRGAVFGQPRLLGSAINEPKVGVHPGIAPDESYLIFDSSRKNGHGKSDLYVSFRRADSSWGQAINMGEKINTPSTDYCASITPDGRFLFYRSRNDLYWVSTEAVERLRTNKVTLERSLER